MLEILDRARASSCSCGVSFDRSKPSSRAFMTMLLRPARSLISTCRVLPTERRIDVLVAAQHLRDRVHVRAALVRERRGADPRQARVRPQVRGLVDELRQLGQLRQRFGRHAALVQLEVQDRHHRRDVAVAGPLAVAVDRALHVRGAGLDRGERVGDAEADVVVRVDADARAQRLARQARDRRDSRRQRSAVGVAQRDDVGAGLLGGVQRGQRVRAVFLEAVEAVLGVVDDELAVLPSGSARCRRSSRGSRRASSAAPRGRGAARSCRRS